MKDDVEKILKRINFYDLSGTRVIMEKGNIYIKTTFWQRLKFLFTNKLYGTKKEWKIDVEKGYGIKIKK